MVAVLSNQPSSKRGTKPPAKKSTLTRELKALGLTDPQEESSRSSKHLPHPETPQPEGPPHPDIETPAETPVPIKQSASSQKPQKLPETTNEPSEPPEPSEPDNSDSDTSEPSRPPPRPPMSTPPPPGPEPGPDPGLSNGPSRPTPSRPTISDSSKLKLPKPGYYTGKGDDRTMEKLQAWADEITFYLMVTNITDNDQKIPFAFLYTKEDARTWMKSWITTTNPDGTLESIDRNFEELLPALTKQFIPSTSIDILQMKWDRISQFREGRIRSITSAAAELRALTLQLPHISDFSKKQRLLSAMIPELGAQVRPHILPTSTWDEIVQLAEQFDAARVMAKRQNGDSLSKNKKPFQKRPSYAQVLTTPSTSSKPGNPRQPSTPKPPFKCHLKLTPEL